MNLFDPGSAKPAAEVGIIIYHRGAEIAEFGVF